MPPGRPLGASRYPDIRNRVLGAFPKNADTTQSGHRESDPGFHLGTVMRCHYAMSARPIGPDGRDRPARGLGGPAGSRPAELPITPAAIGSPLQVSNPSPSPYKGVALPAELSGRGALART